MKIIILGAGQVGASLAENLANEANDITIIDTDIGRLRELQDRLDIRTVNGKASHPSLLNQAGAQDADMLIAVTNSDEVNMIACQIGQTLYNIPTKIARVREHDYLQQENLFNRENLPIDVLISPEKLVTEHIKRMIQYPGALQVLDFADGKAQLVAVKAYYGGPLVGREISYLRTHMPNTDTRVAAIFRQGKAIIPQGNTVIEADDEVFFIAARKDIRSVMSELRRLDNPYKRIIIAGGGNIGARLAENLEKKYQVKIIERNINRCNDLARTLSNTIVLHGSASDRDLLLEENIEDTDVFCALTNDDEANIMASMLAKRLGARSVMTLINNPAYVDLVQGGVIDIAISPQQTTIGALLTHVRRGDVVAVHSLRRGAAEALEAVAHGDKRSSKVVGRALEDINLPPGTTIGAIVRNDEVLIAHDDVIVENGDHVILFLVDKRRIGEVERLFQVGLAFF
ncbi:Trk system potassium transporter TrkA [Neptunomonas phycophila]|jgi:trk system potassium uptake protein TrkA|uniref:Trk system potassium uptake protein TrkA n=1 Tax=Neptunomonas phycophila TaxID=1572645 RepID=A0AAW7XHK9_9GAMM|nr:MULTISPECIES: Trk system potassium transporter TrkA [Neptunomonas]MBT3145582.1 Trk system potassium transporter TrkA [Neptunomonas phycophila]MDN2660078.1 Trk system potassium transporter TrkA [Neptunomonas sp. CHC150]MDO6453102.1 Trk system potassium transporter TrkA [Neptunomonas phycophila]MDO6469202.1 Trk system potassium transporter TrkA [Neptunomonas phycophila]MDO6784458.1 Trk system potassium transporter TrkA [Neptunomonas phycophila]